MHALKDKSVLVIGLALSGQAACRLLLQQGARVTGLDASGAPELRRELAGLESDGVEMVLGSEEIPPGKFDLGVVSPGVPESAPAVRMS